MEEDLGALLRATLSDTTPVGSSELEPVQEADLRRMAEAFGGTGADGTRATDSAQAPHPPAIAQP